MKPTFDHENQQWKNGHHVIGLDEVGRGPLAGPVFVCALAFRNDLTERDKKDICDLGIHDSKKLTKKKRETIAGSLQTDLCSFVIKASPVSLINKRGIVFATHEAMYYALDELCEKLKGSPHYLLLDAFALDLERAKACGQQALVGGDSICLSIAAASILAKVARDAYMDKLAGEFPEYGWEKNKGYGTKQHREAIQTHGVTKHHRELFVRKILTFR
jgi:ribonuclease HII